LTGKKWWKLLFGVLITGLVTYLVLSHMDKIRENISQRDSVQYWKAGKQLVHRENAYEVRRIRTPPWSLFLFLPLGFVNAFWGWLVWIAASVVSLIAAMRLSWKMFRKKDESRSVFTIVGYLFAPVLACLESGQIGLLLLIGIVLFMAYEDEHPYLAGAALILPFAKPHLLVFFWVAFLFWVVAKKKFAIVIGFAVSLIVATAIALLLDPRVFQHYGELVRTTAVEGEFIPTLSTVLRIIFFRPYFRAQFVPTLLGLIWCVWFCVKNISKWSWRDHGLTVMVVSVLTTPYSFMNDEVVLLPAMLFAATCIFAGPRLSVGGRFAVLAIGFLNWIMLLLLALQVPLQSGIYFWSSLLWCAWYFYGQYRLPASDKTAGQQATWS
jgi:glycosyl transferase family 87